MNKRDLLTRIIVGAMIRKGHMDIRSMHRNTVHARRKNEALLFSILKKNKDTEYGKKYGFADIRTVDEFRSRGKQYVSGWSAVKKAKVS